MNGLFSCFDVGADLLQVRAHSFSGGLSVLALYGVEDRFMVELPAFRAAWHGKDLLALLAQQAHD